MRSARGPASRRYSCIRETDVVRLRYGSRAGKCGGIQVGVVGNVWRRTGSVVGLGAATAAATALALVVQIGGAVAGGAAPAHGRGESRALTPTRGTSVTPEFFGMHAPLLATEFPDAPAGAVNLTTNRVYWPSLETSPGVFDLSRLDAIVTQAHDHGATPLLVLGQTPSFHSTSP